MTRISDKPKLRILLQDKWRVLFLSAEENLETVTEEIEETWQLIAMWSPVLDTGGGVGGRTLMEKLMKSKSSLEFSSL